MTQVYVVFKEDGVLGRTFCVVQSIVASEGFFTFHVIEPPGVNPDDPVSTTDNVVVPPRDVAVLVIDPMVGVRVAIPVVT